MNATQTYVDRSPFNKAQIVDIDDGMSHLQRHLHFARTPRKLSETIPEINPINGRFANCRINGMYNVHFLFHRDLVHRVLVSKYQPYDNATSFWYTTPALLNSYRVTYVTSTLLLSHEISKGGE